MNILIITILVAMIFSVIAVMDIAFLRKQTIDWRYGIFLLIGVTSVMLLAGVSILSIVENKELREKVKTPIKYEKVHMELYRKVE